MKIMSQYSSAIKRKHKTSNSAVKKTLLQKIIESTDSCSSFYKINHFEEKLLASANRLCLSYFEKSCMELAQSLLGKVLVRKLPSGEILKGRIVETESYLGVEDKASHSYKGKRTERNAPMFMSPGTAYVYFIYGMYFCFNISSLETGSAVLIRALEPLEGLSTMRKLRSNSQCKPIKDRDLCNGPSKLCQAMMIEKELINKENLITSEIVWLEDGPCVDASLIIQCKRIGIKASAEEWVTKPLRFYIKNLAFVSVKDKVAENIFI